MVESDKVKTGSICSTPPVYLGELSTQVDVLSAVLRIAQPRHVMGATVEEPLERARHEVAVEILIADQRAQAGAIIERGP
jgi:hypothetical protein